MKRILQRINYEIYELFQLIFAHVPGSLGILVRRLFFKFYLKKCGNNFLTGSGIRIQTPKAVTFGKNCGLNDNCWIAANFKEGGQIKFGDNVLIGPNTVIHSGNHVFKDKNKLIREQGFIFKEINIGDDVWIAANCTILAGVSIGNGAVVSAGSLVNKNVEPYTVVAGIPAKIITRRN